ncbi:N-terminal C2 in EEIG1 and EHBP1 proteins-domain-containing protein [Bombardia bombarda]|uniref:N-terminal C2 in EEIG1 and EHBP1 proteins-domain-containing protein n=1 Tax=Bombardia bombarda TaxID=252184 RepID=A0AA39X778_9PEZI|nr:N-terminal C2 in EEIG1 and EHBP1 proteins-domain-containing protein [Bombardia bombarda]
MQFLPLVSKARKPKFELHLTIYDLNNVPLVSGGSLVKWHIPHSIHGEHRGRTPKCPIANHRVEYGYSKLVPLRITIDRNSNLVDCPIEFEVLQEFNPGGASGAIGREEKITLGTIRLNLSEYVEESEAIVRDGANVAEARTSFASSYQGGERSGHQRKRSSLSGISIPTGPDTSPKPSHLSETEEEHATTESGGVREGVVRRYLMQESKINSTLKLGILMLQVDGERNFVAPPLKTAPVFGGIAGLVSGDALEPVDPSAEASGQVPSLSNKSRDVFELQDAYRRVLAASWASQPGELPADQCIEDIFAGGDGFRPSSSDTETHHHHGRDSSSPNPKHHPSTSSHRSVNTNNGNSNGGGVDIDTVTTRTPSTSSSGNSRNNQSREEANGNGGGNNNGGSTSGEEDVMGTLRPRDLARMRALHMRNQSAATDRSSATIVAGGDRDRELTRMLASSLHIHRGRDGPGGKVTAAADGHGHGHGLNSHSRNDSLASLATTVGSDRGRDVYKRALEVDEFEVREDLVAWAAPGASV